MSTTTRSLALSLALSLGLAAGCGGTNDGNNNNNQIVQPDMAQAAGPDLAPSPYPPRPYGTTVGDTLADVYGNGYVLSPDQTDATQMEIKRVYIDVIRLNPDCACLMLSQSATWCGPCNAEQPELVKAVEEDKTFCVFNVLVDGLTPGVRATNEDVTDWNSRHGQNFPIIGASLSSYVSLPNPSALPTNVVIDPVTMKILSITAGLGPTTISDAKQLCMDAHNP